MIKQIVFIADPFEAAYGWIAYTPTTFGASLTNLTVLLPQSHDCSYYVSRPILAPSLLRL